MASILPHSHESGLQSSCLKSELCHPKMFSQVTQNAELRLEDFTMLNNILTSLLPFAALVLSH